jgi:hypothetical protein
MKRRTLLKSAAALGAAAALDRVAPAVHARDKAGGKPAIVGTGEHRYECNHHWGQTPGGFEWQTTHGVAVDAAGLVYIKMQGHGGKPAVDTILVFDPAGKFVRSFGKEYHPGGHGIDIRKEGGQEYLYLSDVAHGWVLKTDLKGEVVWKKGAPEEPGVYKETVDAKTSKPVRPRYSPTNIAFAPDGGFYIGDGYGSHYIHQYDKNAKWVRTWGGAGTEPGKMRTPHGLWLDDRPGREPTLVVADRANARLQYFSLDGKHIGFVKDVSFPAHFDIRGDVLLCPDLHARVTLFDKDNKVISHLGYDPEWTRKALAGFKMRADPRQWADGRFVHPHDACFDKDGNILVVEWVQTGRVSFLKKLA